MIVSFFKGIVDKKNDKVKIDIIPKIKEKNTSVTYGCIRFTDSYRFLSTGSDELIKTLDNDVFDNLKKEFSDKWEYLKKNKQVYK